SVQQRTRISAQELASTQAFVRRRSSPIPYSRVDGGFIDCLIREAGRAMRLQRPLSRSTLLKTPGGRSDPESRETPLLEFRFGPPPRGHSLSDLFLKEGVESRLIACRLTQGRPAGLIRWLEIETPPDRIETLLRSLRRRFRRGHLAVARLGPGSALLRVSEPAPSICAATYVAGGICVSCPL